MNKIRLLWRVRLKRSDNDAAVINGAGGARLPPFARKCLWRGLSPYLQLSVNNVYNSQAAGQTEITAHLQAAFNILFTQPAAGREFSS